MDNIFSDFKVVEHTGKEVLKEYENALPKEIMNI